MKINWKGIAKATGDLLKRRSPEILTGLGLAGMGVSIFFAVKVTPKAVKKLEEDGVDCHKPIEVVKSTWKYYVPAAVSFTTSAACIIGASRTNLRRNAALAAAYSVTETALQDYKAATQNVLGDRKEEQIRDKTAETAVQNNPPTQYNTFISGSYKHMCYDPWSGRYFNYDVDQLKRAIEDLSYQMRDDEFIILNEFYDLIGQERTNAGEILGWSADGGPLRPQFSSTLIHGEEPCLVIGFTRDPTETYRDTRRKNYW